MRVLECKNSIRVAKASIRCHSNEETASTNPDPQVKGLSKSILGRTRKMVNYA